MTKHIIIKISDILSNLIKIKNSTNYMVEFDDNAVFYKTSANDVHSIINHRIIVKHIDLKSLHNISEKYMVFNKHIIYKYLTVHIDDKSSNSYNIFNSIEEYCMFKLSN